MIDRRKFIKAVSALGISLPLVKSSLKGGSNYTAKNNPTIKKDTILFILPPFIIF